ncbi:MAG: DNA-binding protein [Pedosphaera sp.]|nr:DNA-binding protein [Pedosphaera sp.]
MNSNSFARQPVGGVAAAPNTTPTTRRLSRTELTNNLLAPSESSSERIRGLLSRGQVAQQLGMCAHTVQRLTKRGLLPALVFNRRLIRYRAEDVDRFIQGATAGKKEAL